MCVYRLSQWSVIAFPHIVHSNHFSHPWSGRERELVGKAYTTQTLQKTYQQANEKHIWGVRKELGLGGCNKDEAHAQILVRVFRHFRATLAIRTTQSSGRSRNCCWHDWTSLPRKGSVFGGLLILRSLARPWMRGPWTTPGSSANPTYWRLCYKNTARSCRRCPTPMARTWGTSCRKSSMQAWNCWKRIPGGPRRSSSCNNSTLSFLGAKSATRRTAATTALTRPTGTPTCKSLTEPTCRRVRLMAPKSPKHRQWPLSVQ